jgi:hypothetical protein
MRSVEVHYDEQGRIVSVVDVGEVEGIRAGIAPLPEHRAVRVTIDPEYERLSLLELHTRFRLDLDRDSPRLVPVTAPGRDFVPSLKGVQPRYEALVTASAGGTLDLKRLAELDLDRVPDPEGLFRVLIDRDEASRLVEAGFEVRLLNVVPRAPLDPGLLVDDDAARSWLEEEVRGVERDGDA